MTARTSNKIKTSGDRKMFTLAGIDFNIDKKYHPKKKLGKGAYGMVISAKDTEEDKWVAIKKIEDVFDSMTDSKRIIREIKLMRHLQHRNILNIVDMIEPDKKDDFRDVYIVSDYMQSDLHRIINSNNDLSEQHIQYIVYQILCGVKYMHSANVIHRDLKPANLLINDNCDIKICDFGLARGVVEEREDEDLLTEYVVTRWYRAPEVICQSQKYGFAIDVWSIGCILAELFLREPLFQGENYLDQLVCIFNVIGSPTDEDLKCVTNEGILKRIMNSRKREAQNLSDILPPNVSEEAIDLISKMLLFDPEKRITVDEALEHPFFDLWRSEEVLEESVCESMFDFSFEEEFDDTADTMKRIMFEEVLQFRPECAYSLDNKKRAIEKSS